jgi:hypothetical protein
MPLDQLQAFQARMPIPADDDVVVPAAFGTIISDAIEKWAKVIKFAGIKAE